DAPDGAVHARVVGLDQVRGALLDSAAVGVAVVPGVVLAGRIAHGNVVVQRHVAGEVHEIRGRGAGHVRHVDEPQASGLAAGGAVVGLLGEPHAVRGRRAVHARRQEVFVGDGATAGVPTGHVDGVDIAEVGFVDRDH